MSKEKISLLSALEYKGMSFKNRVFMAPMTRNRADHENNTQSGINALYYAQRASAGLIFSEATQISQEGQGYAWTPGIYTEEHIKGWRIVTEAVHNAGGKIFCQLWHVGAISHPVFQKDNQKPISSSPFTPEGQAFVGDKHPDGPQIDFVEARGISEEEIPRLLEDFKHASLCAMKAGFDGVEIHGANGYLIDQFIRDSVNHRTDSYGGSTENRCKLLKEITDAVLEVWEPERVGVRLSPVGGLGGSYDSNPLRTYTQAAKAISGKGLLYLHAIRPNSHTAKGEDENSDIIKSMRETFDGLFVVNGEFEPEEAKQWIQDGKADAVSFGRLFLANPDLPTRIKNGGPYNSANEDDFYGGAAKGYIDYPSLNKVPLSHEDKTISLK